MWCTACLPVWLFWLTFSLIFWLLEFHAGWFSGISGYLLVLECCYPPCGCVRRWRFSTYASISARTPIISNTDYFIALVLQSSCPCYWISALYFLPWIYVVTSQVGVFAYWILLFDFVFLLKLYFRDYAIRVLSVFPLYLPPPSTPNHSHNPHTIVHVHGSCIYVLWLLHFLYCTLHPHDYSV